MSVRLSRIQQGGKPDRLPPLVSSDRRRSELVAEPDGHRVDGTLRVDVSDIEVETMMQRLQARRRVRAERIPKGSVRGSSFRSSEGKSMPLWRE
jgi:hypothetical protein